MKHQLAIITVFYNNYPVGFNFLKSLANQKKQNFHLFVADLSDKKEANLGYIYQSLPFIGEKITIINAPNRGYAHGVNLGLKMALGKNYTKFCVINNDTYFKNNFVDRVWQGFDKKPHSIIGGKIYYAPGFEYHQNRYQKKDLGKVIWYAGGFFDWKNILTPHRGVDEVDKGQYMKMEETEFVTGCLMLFDKKVIEEVGFWDESYFLYYEDADFCWRAHLKKIKIYYDPKIIIWHKNSQSIQGSGSILQQKYQRKSRLKFGLRYAPWQAKIHLLLGR